MRPDETADVYLILRTPYKPEARLQSYLDRLAITVDAQIVNSQAPGRESPPVVETIFSDAVDDIPKPLVVVSDPEAAQGDGEASGSSSSSSSEDDESSGQDTEGDGAAQKTNKTRRKRQTYIVWKRPVFLARPRARLLAPTVSFSAAASLRPARPVANGVSFVPYDGFGDPLAAPSLSSSSAGQMTGYLRSREPSGLNLLESFGGDPALGGAVPQLSAQRVARVAPVAAAAMDARFQPRPVRALKALALKIFPAVHTRVRFARPSAVPTSPAVVAMLEIDFTPFFECDAVLTHIALALPSGVVTDLNRADGLALPVPCAARDHFTFLYRLAPLEFATSQPPASSSSHHPLSPPPLQLNPLVRGGPGAAAAAAASAAAAAAAAATRDIDIAIEAQMVVKPGVCTPTLRMNWTTNVDFTPPVNPGFGTALLPASSLQRAHRPSQLSIDGMSSFTLPSVSRPDALPALEAAAARSTEATIPDFGITMTFTAPAHAVYAGEEFSWTVFVVNRATSLAFLTGPGGGPGSGPGGPGGALPARKLALIALPKRRRNDVRVIRPPSTAGTRYPHSHHHTQHPPPVGGSAPLEAVADAVLDDNIVHAMQRSSLVDSTDVVCLSSADTRVGPLAPNACHVVELRFVALRAGVVGIEAIRVVDLGSQEHVDVRELPTMIIAEGRRGSDG